MSKINVKSWAILAVVTAGMVAACSDSKKDEPTNNISLGGGVAAAGKANAGSPGAATGGSVTTTGGTPGASGSTSVIAAAGSTGVVGAAGSTSIAGAAGEPSLAGASNNGGAPNTAGAANLAGAAGQADCEDVAKKCFKCAATTNEQLVNHCTDYKCIPFDNSTLKKIVNGVLPPIP